MRRAEREAPLEVARASVALLVPSSVRALLAMAVLVTRLRVVVATGRARATWQTRLRDLHR